MLQFIGNAEDSNAMSTPTDHKKVFCYRERSTIHNGLTRFYSSTKFSDITIVAPDGQKIFVHQVVLASCSKRFADVLEAGSLHGEELPVRGVDPTGLESVLKFFYTGECNLDHTNVIPVYDAAHRLDVPGLSSACEQFMREILSPATACMLLQQTVQFLMQDYAENCMGVIRANFEEAANSDDFLAINFQTLVRILNDSSTATQPDMLIFKAVWNWGISEPAHLVYLPEILKLVKMPEVPMEDIVKLIPSPISAPPAGAEGSEEAAAAPAAPAPGTIGSLHQMLIDDLMANNDIHAVARKVAEEATAINTAAAAAAAPVDPSKQQGANLTGGTVQHPGGAGFNGPGQQLMLNQPGGEHQMDGQGNYPCLRLEPLRMNAMEGSGNNGQGAAGGNFPMGGTLVLQPFSQAGSQQQGLLSPQLLGGNHHNPSYGSLLMQDNPMPMSAPPSSRSHGGGGTKGVCQVEGCYQDLSGLRDYHVRYKICETHLKAPFIPKDGQPHRFCQQCGRFHHLDEFDGEKRSCRARLQKHNARRRKKADGDMQDNNPNSPKHQRMMDGHDMMHQAFSSGFNASMQYQDYLPMQGGGGMLPGMGGLSMGVPTRLSPAALSMLADAAQQDGGNGAATAAALSALGALAAAPSDDSSASMMMAMAGGGMLGGSSGNSAEDAARVEQTQQMLAELAAGNGMAAWQGALRAVAASMGSGANGVAAGDGEAGAAANTQQGGNAAGVDTSSLDPLLDLLARTTAAAAAAGADTNSQQHKQEGQGMDEAAQQSLLAAQQSLLHTQEGQDAQEAMQQFQQGAAEAPQEGQAQPQEVDAQEPAAAEDAVPVEMPNLPEAGEAVQEEKEGEAPEAEGAQDAEQAPPEAPVE